MLLKIVGHIRQELELVTIESHEKCFRNLKGAKEFSLRRSYLVTARKNGVSSIDALRMLFKGEKPFFMRE